MCVRQWAASFDPEIDGPQQGGDRIDASGAVGTHVLTSGREDAQGSPHAIVGARMT